MTPDDRNDLLDRLGELGYAEFDELVARLGVPAKYLSRNTVPVMARAIELLDYVGQVKHRPVLDHLREHLQHDARADVRRSAPAVRGRDTSPVLTTAAYIATRLDRVEQWRELTRICAGTRPAVAVLYGQRNQDLPYFFQRMRDRSADHEHDLRAVAIPLFRSGVQLKTASELEQGLQEVLARELEAREGTPEALVGEAAAHRPLVIVIGRKPPDDLAPHAKALREFLKTRAPRLVTAAKCAVVFFFHIYSTDLAVVRGVARAARGFEYRELTELSLPSMQDVENCLYESDLRPDKAIIGTTIEYYKDLIGANPSISLVELSHRLAEKLEELMGI